MVGLVTPSMRASRPSGGPPNTRTTARSAAPASAPPRRRPAHRAQQVDGAGVEVAGVAGRTVASLRPNVSIPSSSPESHMDVFQVAQRAVDLDRAASSTPGCSSGADRPLRPAGRCSSRSARPGCCSTGCPSPGLPAGRRRTAHIERCVERGVVESEPHVIFSHEDDRSGRRHRRVDGVRHRLRGQHVGLVSHASAGGSGPATACGCGRAATPSPPARPAAAASPDRS